MRRKNDVVDDWFILRANSRYNGGAWYDFALMDFAFANEGGNSGGSNDSIKNGDCTCVCMVLGFFRYHKAGTASPHLVEECRHDALSVMENGMDDPHLYAAIHASEDWMKYSDLISEFSCPFVLGDPSETLYLVKLEHLVAPMIVYPDVGGPRRQYHAILPCRHWPKYYSNYIDKVNPSRDENSLRVRRRSRNRLH